MTKVNIKNNMFNISIIVILIIYVYYGSYPKHSDFWIMNYVAKSFAIGNYDFYEDILNIQKLPKSFVAYPPTWYIIQGSYIKILSLIFSYDLHGWQQPRVYTAFMPLFGILPNIFVFFIGGLIIFKIYGKKELIIYYLASPLAFVSIEVMGQIDIYPMFFTLISLYFAKKSFDASNQLWKIASIVSLGIGGQFKLYPLLLLVPMSIFLADKKVIQTIKYILFGLITGTAPWIGYMKWFRLIVIDGESSWLFNFQLFPVNLPPYHTISIWFIGYCIILWVVLKYINFNFRNLIGIIFMEVSWFFISVYTHPQWWIWLVPVSILILAEFRNRTFIFFYIVLNFLYILYPMMWADNVDIIMREYIPVISIVGNNSIVLVSVIVSILLIWNFELMIDINKKINNENRKNNIRKNII